MKKIPFVKMHGAGNDFVYLDRAKLNAPVSSKTARLLLDRHFGIGGDQLLVLKKNGRPGHFDLDIFNSDGSMAEMCGNGVRAVAAYLKNFDRVKGKIVIDTKGGPKPVDLSKSTLEVDMGEPILEGRKIPVKASGEIVNRPFKVAGRTYKIHAVSMGNPHCVIYVDDVQKFPVQTVGPLIETNSFFPRRVNVEFVQILNKGHVLARVWERGAGETLACGTGACAITVAGARIGVTSPKLKIDLPGGQLGAWWADNNHVFLTGPAQVTYKGEFQIL